MKIMINGKETEIKDGISVSELLVENNVASPQMVTVELNEEILRREVFDDTIIKADDVVEFLYFMGGGEIEPKKKTVFLGGTCAESTWRDELINMLEIDYFNPVVEDWTPECMAEEIEQRKTCDYVLYVITPLMKGVYSIAEVVDDSNKRPEKTIFCVMETYESNIGAIIGFDVSASKSLGQVKKMVAENGGKVCESLAEIADYVNGE